MILSRIKKEYTYLRTSSGQRRLLRFTRAYYPAFRTALLWPLFLPLAVLLRVLLVVLKPLVHVRFGRVWVFNMGNHAICTEIYLCQSDVGELPKRSFDIFYPYIYEDLLRGLIKPKTVPANKQLDLMFRRCLRVSEAARALDHLNRMIPWGSLEYCVDGPDPYDRYDHLQRAPIHLSFTAAEEERGRIEKINMGVDPNEPFICFYARDGVFLKELFPRITSVYGEYGVVEQRNSDIDNYLQAAERLTDLGYYAIRMGKHVEKAITPPNPRVVDYATSFHSDFMDVYLSARCKFFIANNGGMVTLPVIFRKPLVIVNLFPLANGIDNTTCINNISIPKMIYSSEKGDFLTFRESLELSFACNGMNSQAEWKRFDDSGFKLVENTPEEISEVAIEMEQRLESTFEESEEDRELQRRWLSIVLSYPKIIILEPGLDQRLKIGTHFLRSHPGWLD